MEGRDKACAGGALDRKKSLDVSKSFWGKRFERGSGGVPPIFSKRKFSFPLDSPPAL